MRRAITLLTSIIVPAIAFIVPAIALADMPPGERAAVRKTIRSQETAVTEHFGRARLGSLPRVLRRPFDQIVQRVDRLLASGEAQLDARFGALSYSGSKWQLHLSAPGRDSGIRDVALDQNNGKRFIKRSVGVGHRAIVIKVQHLAPYGVNGRILTRGLSVLSDGRMIERAEYSGWTIKQNPSGSTKKAVDDARHYLHANGKRAPITEDAYRALLLQAIPVENSVDPNLYHNNTSIGPY
jgi:hypothetical protein